MPRLEVFLTTQNLNIVFLTETFSDSTIAHDDTNLDTAAIQC